MDAQMILEFIASTEAAASSAGNWINTFLLLVSIYYSRKTLQQQKAQNKRVERIEAHVGLKPKLAPKP